MIAVFAYDRPEFLKPCLDSLPGEKEMVHVFIDAVAEQGTMVSDICRDSGFACHATDDKMGIGWQRKKAVQMFLDDQSLGDHFVFCDSDIVFGSGSLELLKKELGFWWKKGFPVGMLCCGYQLQSTPWLVMKDEGHAIIPAHGGEQIAMLPRQALEKTGNCVGIGMLGNTAPLKNKLAKVGLPRAILVEPMPNVQHIGAFKTSLSPQFTPAELIYRNRAGSPLNPRPDLFDVSQACLSADIMEKPR